MFEAKQSYLFFVSKSKNGLNPSYPGVVGSYADLTKGGYSDIT